MSDSDPPLSDLLARASRLIAAAGPTRAVQSISPQVLEQLLASPARRIVLEAIFWHAARQLARRTPDDVTWTVRCYLMRNAEDQEPDVYELHSRAGGCSVVRGAGEGKPAVTVALDDAELVRLITGQSTPAQGLFNGRIMVRGDLAKAAVALAAAFRTQPPR
jgi:SCP-2 sterol transfer family